MMMGLAGGKGYGKAQKVNDHGEPERMVYIKGLPFKVKWQELKEFLGTAGTVEFVKIFEDDFGRPKGNAVARYSTVSEAKKAIKKFNMAEMGERYLEVGQWTKMDQ